MTKYNSENKAVLDPSFRIQQVAFETRSLQVGVVCSYGRHGLNRLIAPAHPSVPYEIIEWYPTTTKLAGGRRCFHSVSQVRLVDFPANCGPLPPERNVVFSHGTFYG